MTAIDIDQGVIDRMRTRVDREGGHFYETGEALDIRSLIEIAEGKLFAFTQGGEVAPDVRRLVTAARVIAYQADGADADDHRRLDQALEAFASRLPWDDGPAALSAHAGEAGGERVPATPAGMVSESTN